MIALGATSTTLALWKFHVNFATPANSARSPGPTTITVPSYAEACSGGTCIPQSGGGRLDSLADRLMYRAAYRNFGDHEALVVEPRGHRGRQRRASAGTRSGICERHAGGRSRPRPTRPTATYRWMGSIAMDKRGNIALGYSASSSSIVPQIRFTGRLAADALERDDPGREHDHRGHRRADARR